MPDKFQHIVLLVHGMRTQASWAEMVAHVLEEDPQIKVQPIKYGFFDIFRFLFPFWTREKPIRRIIREYRDIRQKNPNAKISVIAHSFGTYALTKALLEPDLEFFRIVFCGSIAPDEFRVANHRAQIEADQILNDCGSHDVWPLLARSVTWGYGASGTFGFGTTGIKDRFNKFSHSEYFSAEFVREYWQPYISNGEIVPTDWESNRETVPYWQSLLSIFPLKWIALAFITFLGFLGWQACIDSKVAQAELDYPLGIRHLLGRAEIIATVSFDNPIGSNALFSGFRGELYPPNGAPIEVVFEAFLAGEFRLGDIAGLNIPSNETESGELLFVGSLSDQSSVVHDIENYIRANPVTWQVWDRQRAVLSETLAEALTSIAVEEFPWIPGEWRFVFRYTINDEQKSTSITFNVSENDVSQIGSAIPHYISGLGVISGWDYIGPNGQPSGVILTY